MKKKMLSFISLGLVCILFFQSCMTKNPEEEAQLQLALEIPEKIISNHEAAVLFQNDQTTRLYIIGKQTLLFKDKSIHFDFAVLTNYITHVEAIAKKEKIPITGVNFIFGADTNGNRTVFLMPSIRNTALDYQQSFTVENGQLLPFTHIHKLLTPEAHSKNERNLILSATGYLSFNDAVTLFNRYEHQYITPFAKKVSKAYYTKAVWYSLDELKGYLHYLKKKSNDYNLRITGIDVYFGVYDTAKELALKSNAQTLFLTASSQQTSIINTQKKSLKEYIANDFFVKNTNDTTDESLAFNMGQLSPPPK